MVSVAAFADAEKSARKLASQCANEAAGEIGERKAYLLSEAKRHDDRANDYKMRAGWYAPKQGEKQ